MRLEHHRFARLSQGVHGELVAHRAARHIDGRLLAGECRDALLERQHCRVIPVDIVADDRTGNRLSHGRSRAGDGVATQVNGGRCGHGWVSGGREFDSVTRVEPLKRLGGSSGPDDNMTRIRRPGASAAPLGSPQRAYLRARPGWVVMEAQRWRADSD